jgi:transcriptional regulator with XRE-family HTH domain
MQIAARIRRVRLQRALSLTDLALGTGLSTSLLSRYEDGQDVPSLETLDRFAAIMGVPVRFFFYGDTDSKLTPSLTARPTLLELSGRSSRTRRTVAASFFQSRRLRAAVTFLRLFITGTSRR